MNFMKNFVKVLTQYEVKMARKTQHIKEKRVRDKRMRIDRRLKDTPQSDLVGIIVWIIDLNTSFLFL